MSTTMVSRVMRARATIRATAACPLTAHPSCRTVACVPVGTTPFSGGRMAIRMFSDVSADGCLPIARAHDVEEMRTIRAHWEANHFKNTGAAATVGFVPTMGSLHDGHLSLIEAAAETSDRVCASIFVNPAQFAPHEDLDAYTESTRIQLEKDITRLEAAGCDAVFIPTPEVIYHPTPADRCPTRVVLDGIDERGEGAARPGFFSGVATVVTSLFNIVRPTHAFFGQKDGLQCIVVRQIARDLHLNVDVRVLPTWRETDGLAMSSRNVRLSDAERAAAPGVYKCLQAMSAMQNSGVTTTAGALADTGTNMLNAQPLMDTDYVSIADAASGRDLAPEETMRPDGAYLVSVAVTMEESGTRLLDNHVIGAGAKGLDALGVPLEHVPALL